jgi:hypothetical protein
VPKRRSGYPHVTITEKEKGQQQLKILSHKHPTSAIGHLQFRDKDGKNLKINFSIPEIPEIQADKDWIGKKCVTYQICGDLWVAVWRNNPDKGFFYISGNKKSVQFRIRDLRRVPNRVLAVLKYSKKDKTRMLNTNKELFKGLNEHDSQM